MAEGIVLFLALNRIGVVANFVHPQTPVKALADILDETGSRGIAVHESVAADYASVIRERELPVVFCTIGTYADAGKPSAPQNPDALAPYAGPRTALYGEFVRRGGERIEVSVAGEDVALYLQGGGTTVASRTIMLSNDNIVSFCGIYLNSLGITGSPGIDTSINCMPLFHCYELFNATLVPMCCGGPSARNRDGVIGTMRWSFPHELGTQQRLG